MRVSIASLPASWGQPGSIAGFQLIARHLLLRQPGDFARRPIAPPFRSGAVSILLKPSGSAVRVLLRRCQFCAFPACRRNRTLTCRGLLSESAGRQRNHPRRFMRILLKGSAAQRLVRKIGNWTAASAPHFVQTLARTGWLEPPSDFVRKGTHLEKDGTTQATTLLATGATAPSFRAICASST